MANEATIQSSLAITKDNLSYRTAAASFRADVTGTKGPSPGAITVSVSGTDVDLSQLTRPGLCYLKNLDSTNYVTVGMRDPDTGSFQPMLKLLPGEGFVLRLAGELLSNELTGTGTATGNSTLRIRAYSASCVVLVEAFEE